MTANQNEKATTADKSLLDVVCNLEWTHVQLTQIRNMLAIYDERIEDDLTAIKEDRDMVPCFVSRYDLLRSMMEVMQNILNSAVDEMETQVNVLYELHKKAKTV